MEGRHVVLNWLMGNSVYENIQPTGIDRCKVEIKFCPDITFSGSFCQFAWGMDILVNMRQNSTAVILGGNTLLQPLIKSESHYMYSKKKL